MVVPRTARMPGCSLALPPPLYPTQCPCVEQIGNLGQHPIRRRCRPSKYCSCNALVNTSNETLIAKKDPAAAYVTVIHLDSVHTRPQWRRNPIVQWRQQVDRVSDLWNNLQRVNASLPFLCLTSGRNSTAALESPSLNQTMMRLSREGVVFMPMQAPVVPLWASVDKQSAFAKLAVWNASLQFGLRLCASPR